MTAIQRLVRQLCLVLTPLVLVASLLVGYGSAPVGASSHREAPLISSDPDADATDFYMFVSPDRTDTVTLIANYIPFEAPEGAPNFNRFSSDVLYEINIDNVGDGKAHLTYQFRFTKETRNPETFLYNTGTITPQMIESTSDKTWNLRQSYSVTEVRNIGTAGAVTKTLGTNLPTPPSNIGTKSTPNYPALAAAAIKTISESGDSMKVFAGQRDDPFWVDLGSIFDLLTLRPAPAPIGYSTPSAGIDALSGFNTHSIVLQVPISRLLQGAPAGETVIGGWTTASRPRMRVYNTIADVLFDGAAGQDLASGDFVQVSRLGMPLTNEVVIPIALKDAFNSLKPEQDSVVLNAGLPQSALLAKSVLDPELQRLLKALYNVPNPGTNRTDIFEIFLTGMTLGADYSIIKGTTPITVPAGTSVNTPLRNQNASTTVPAEMLRLNTATPFRPGTPDSLCSTTPSYLGVLGGDVCGFPNGRRLDDDVVEIELLAVAGAAWTPLTGDTSFTFNRGLIGVLDDGLDYNDVDFNPASATSYFLPTFPYVGTPHQGQEHIHTNLSRVYMPITITDGGD